MIPPPPSASPAADAELAAAIAAAGGHGASAMALAVAFDQLGDIDLPPAYETQVDQAQMRALATLYLAADLEPAGVIPAVEQLAGLASTGALPADLAGATALVHDFWRGRNERVNAAERAAFFSRLFGTAGSVDPASASANVAFEDRLLDLCEALYKLDELATNRDYGGIAQQARVRAAASALVGNLVAAGGGITAFLAQEILATLKEALAILTRPELRGAFGARDVWGVVAAIGRLARRRQPDPLPYVRRGRAGMTVLAWLAEVAPHLGGDGQPVVGLEHPVITAAIDWMEASLAIGEAVSAPSPPARPMPGMNSPWAAIGA